MHIADRCIACVHSEYFSGDMFFIFPFFNLTKMCVWSIP